MTVKSCFKVLVVGLSLIATGPSASAQSDSKKPVSREDLIQMKKAGFDDDTIVKAIESNGARIDTSAVGLVQLKEAGFSDAIIRAALGGSKAEPHAFLDTTKLAVPDEAGLYFLKDGGAIPLKVEVVNFKSGGMLKAMGTMGISKIKYKGTCTGTKSPTQASLPIVLLVRTPEGSDPAEYQLVKVEPRDGRREFVVGKGGLTGVSIGVGEIAIPMKFEKLTRNVYRTEVKDLTVAEYAILPPGSIPTGPGITAGKVYTFGVQ